MLAADGDVLNPVPGVDGQSVAFGNLGHFFLGSGYIENPHHFGGFSPQNDVLGNRKGIHQHEVLMNHADTVLDSHIGIADFDLLPLDANPALGRTVETVKTVHQGRLAGSVFPQERMHFAFVYR